MQFNCEMCHSNRVSCSSVDNRLVCRDCLRARKPGKSKKRAHRARVCVSCALRPVAAKVTMTDGRLLRLCKPCAIAAPTQPLALEFALRCYGERLDVVVRREATLPVPLLCARLAAFIARSGALRDEGVFRVAGRKDRADRLRGEVEGGGAPPTASELARRGVDPHVATAVFKQYLRQLPDPLLTSTLYAPLLALATELTDDGTAPDGVRTRLRALLEQLPEANRALLSVLLHLLDLAVQNSATTRMTPRTAAICVSPTILYLPTPTTSDPALLLAALEPARVAAAMASATRVVAALVRYYPTVWRQGPLVDGGAILDKLCQLDNEPSVEMPTLGSGSSSAISMPDAAPVRKPALPPKDGVPLAPWQPASAAATTPVASSLGTRRSFGSASPRGARPATATHGDLLGAIDDEDDDDAEVNLPPDPIDYSVHSSYARKSRQISALDLDPLRNSRGSARLSPDAVLLVPSGAHRHLHALDLRGSQELSSPLRHAGSSARSRLTQSAFNDSDDDDADNDAPVHTPVGSLDEYYFGDASSRDDSDPPQPSEQPPPPDYPPPPLELKPLPPAPGDAESEESSFEVPDDDDDDDDALALDTLELPLPTPPTT